MTVMCSIASRVRRYWQRYLPVDFKGHTPLHKQVTDLQELMRENEQADMADFIAMDSLYVPESVVAVLHCTCTCIYVHMYM